jgi:hypothetical protein
MTDNFCEVVDISFTTEGVTVSFDLEKWGDDGELEKAISACDGGSVEVEKSIVDRVATLRIHGRRTFGYKAEE